MNTCARPRRVAARRVAARVVGVLGRLTCDIPPPCDLRQWRVSAALVPGLPSHDAPGNVDGPAVGADWEQRSSASCG